MISFLVLASPRIDFLLICFICRTKFPVELRQRKLSSTRDRDNLNQYPGQLQTEPDHGAHSFQFIVVVHNPKPSSTTATRSQFSKTQSQHSFSKSVPFHLISKSASPPTILQLLLVIHTHQSSSGRASSGSP